MVESSGDLLLHNSTESVLSHNFHDLDVVLERLAAFETRYNQAAKPFKWKFTTTDLTDFLNGLNTHRPAINAEPAQPRAA